MDHKRKVGMTALGVVSLIAGSVILYKAHQADKKNEVLTLNMASQPLVHHGEAGQKEQHQVTKSPQHQAFYELRQARRYIRIAKVSGYSLQAIGVFTIIVA